MQVQGISGKRILITGGLGFIGFNTALKFSQNNEVLVIDDCSRVGVDNNIRVLSQHQIKFQHVDIAGFKELRSIFFSFQPEIVIHMAAQVAVTLSIQNPFKDFRSNLQGSFNLLELSRMLRKKPIILYASTNKVYGGDINARVQLKGKRYIAENAGGFSEDVQLSFETPYGCSKGGADQYFLDYCKTFDVPTVVFRQSCIYGPHQFGMEDQGWVAWFAIRAVFQKPITIYGDGNQVRDLLYIDDLVRLYELAILNIDAVKGQAFNVGGGADNTLSLNELIEILNTRSEEPLKVSHSGWRLGDQKVYISDIRKIRAALDWRPMISPQEGVEKLLAWVREEREYVSHVGQTQKEARAQTDVSTVIPAKNEESCLQAVLEEIELFLENFAYSTEVILVNDRSTDKTVELARQFPFVKVIDSKYKPGKGGALRSGFDIARGKYIAMMDADYSHDIYDLPDMLDKVKKHNGIVVGSRITGGSEEYTRVRAFGNIILTWCFGLFHGRYLSDALNGFKIFHRDVYHQFEYTSDAYEIEIELLVNALRLKREISEVPSRERPRLAGKLKSSVVRHGTLFLSRIIWESLRKPKRKEAAAAMLLPSGLQQATAQRQFMDV